MMKEGDYKYGTDSEISLSISDNRDNKSKEKWKEFEETTERDE